MAAYPALGRVAVATVAVSGLTIEEKLRIVVTRAAGKVPGEVGRQLLALVEPRALAIMAGVVVAWAGSQFFGVGEIADVVLLVAGWIAFGGIAWQAGSCLLDFAYKTSKAQSDADLDKAAVSLARAVTLLGVQTVLALILKKPGETFKDQYFASPAHPDPIPLNSFDNLPTNRPFGYKPSIKGDPSLPPGVGATDVYTGDITYSMAGSLQDQQLAKAHEAVHQFLTPKLNLLRGLRGFTRVQGYNRSYILRYLEEALAETVAQLRVKGFTAANVLEGVRFPVRYEYVTIAKIQSEVKGLLLGPINVGGQVFNVWYSQQ